MTAFLVGACLGIGLSSLVFICLVLWDAFRP